MHSYKECTACPSTEEGTAPMYVDKWDGRCKKCAHNGCTKCRANGRCDACGPGFRAKQGSCQQCLKGCADCSKGTASCVKCLPGHHLNSARTKCSK